MFTANPFVIPIIKPVSKNDNDKNKLAEALKEKLIPKKEEAPQSKKNFSRRGKTFQTMGVKSNPLKPELKLANCKFKYDDDLIGSPMYSLNFNLLKKPIEEEKSDSEEN